jgi:hypothetical protein
MHKHTQKVVVGRFDYFKTKTYKRKKFHLGIIVYIFNKHYYNKKENNKYKLI